MNIGNAIYGLIGAGTLVFLIGGFNFLCYAFSENAAFNLTWICTRFQQWVCLPSSLYGIFQMHS